MKLKILPLLAFILLFGTVSCSKDEDAEAAITKKFVGTWDFSYEVNCGGGYTDFTGEIVITKSDDDEYELIVVVPPVGEYYANMTLGGAGLNPYFYVFHEDENGEDTYINGELNDDGMLEVDGSNSDDDPLFYCAFNGIAEKQ
jgi:hypothetical protein